MLLHGLTASCPSSGRPATTRRPWSCLTSVARLCADAKRRVHAAATTGKLAMPLRLVHAHRMGLRTNVEWPSRGTLGERRLRSTVSAQVGAAHQAGDLPLLTGRRGLRRLSPKWWKRVAGLGLVATGGLVLLRKEWDEEAALAVTASLPRTAWAIWWGVRTAASYRLCALLHADQGGAEYDAALRAVHLRSAARLKQLCDSNGGVYIKTAQMLSTAQTVPMEYRRALEVLQDQVAPRSFADVERALQRELGRPSAELFAEFETRARAAASLAQVHKARLFDGQEVAVKVQYLGLETAAQADLTTLRALCAAAAWLFPGSFKLGWVFEDLQANLARELDFGNEAAHAARLTAHFAGARGVAVPRVFPQLSGRRVLTMEWVDGCRVTDVAALRAARIAPHDTAMLLLHSFAAMIFEHGFVHADAHPGNCLVRSHPGPQRFWYRWLARGWREPQLVLLDHGLYVSVPEAMRLAYCQLWCAFVLRDTTSAQRAAACIAGPAGGEILPVVLRPGGYAGLSTAERAALRASAGVGSSAELSAALAALPRPFLGLLRASAVVRGAAAVLGASSADSLRVNATHAVRGLGVARTAGGELRAQWRPATYALHARVALRILYLRVMFWAWSCCAGLWERAPRPALSA